MSTKSREEIIKLVLPTMLIATGYLLFFSNSIRKENQIEQNRFAQADDTKVTERDLMLAKTKSEVALDNLNLVQDEIDALQTQMDASSERFGNIELRFQVLKVVGRLMEKHDLALVEQIDVTKPKLTSYQNKVIEQIKDRDESVPLVFRECKFLGNYDNVYRFFKEFSDSDVHAFPVHLELEEAPDNQQGTHWKMVLLI